MKIVTLIENEISEDQVKLKTESGLSLYVETGNKKILFDTGSSGAFAENADRLGVDISKVDMVIVSHAHYDHTGGLEKFFQLNSFAKVYINEQAKGSYFYKLFFLKKYIGTNHNTLKTYAERFVFVNNELRISDNIKIVTNIIKKHKLPSDSKHFMAQKNNVLIPDDFSHEQILVITENQNLYVFTGCSHNGIVNMVESVKDMVKGKRMNVIGGFHMYNPITKGLSEKKEDVIHIAELLNNNKNIDKIATGHCTGKDAFGLLKNVLGEKLVNLNTGSSITM